MHQCGACNGTGDCHDEHHDFFEAMADGGTFGIVATACPACGKDPSTPGKCSVCGGSGEQNDDNDDW
jgi:hypothetical protein